MDLHLLFLTFPIPFPNPAVQRYIWTLLTSPITTVGNAIMGSKWYPMPFLCMSLNGHTDSSNFWHYVASIPEDNAQVQGNNTFFLVDHTSLNQVLINAHTFSVSPQNLRRSYLHSPNYVMKPLKFRA